MKKIWIFRNKGNHSKRYVLKTFLLAVIFSGLWFSLSNAGKFAKGYSLGQSNKAEQEDTDRVSAATDPTLQKSTQADPLAPQGKLPPVAKAQYSRKKRTMANAAGSQLSLYPERPETGEKIGELYIPKLNSTLPIYEGTDEDELEKGVGHFADSVLPGEADNTVLSGHRDTVFRRLGEIGEGDQLIVRTSAGEFTYKVNKVRIVDKDDRTVIVPKPKATLTVSTCYPFRYIGSAPDRYILVAYLASEKLY